MTSHLLIGGSGAVGAVYGYYLSQAGARVGVLVRPKYATELNKAQRILLHDLNVPMNRKLLLILFVFVISVVLFYWILGLSLLLSITLASSLAVIVLVLSARDQSTLSNVLIGKAPIRTWSDFEVYSSLAEAKNTTWDYIWLCTSATSFQEGTWLKDTLAVAASNDRTVIVCLSPRLTDKQLILSTFPFPERVVMGVISFQSYQNPLQRESFHPTLVSQDGIAYFFGLSNFFSGAPSHVTTLVSTMKRSGFPTAKHEDCITFSAYPGAILNLLIAALEIAGWSFSKLQSHSITVSDQSGTRQESTLAVTAHAGREATALVAKKLGQSGPPLILSLLLFAPILKLLLWLAPLVMPFDFEAFLAYHFHKVGDQTTLLLTDFIDWGKEFGKHPPNVQAIVSALKQTRQKQ